MSAPDPKVFPMAYIRYEVGKEFSVPPGWLLRQDRHADVATPRLVAYMLCYDVLGATLVRIGDNFHRAPSTVLQGRDRILKSMRSDPELAARVATVKKRVSAAITPGARRGLQNYRWRSKERGDDPGAGEPSPTLAGASAND